MEDTMKNGNGNSMKFQSKILQDHARSVSIVFKILPNGARYRRFRPQQAFGVSHEKVEEKGEEQQRRREKEGSWTSTVPAPPQWSQVQALPSTTSVRGEP